VGERKGRSRLTLTDDVEFDLRNMGVKWWRRSTSDRIEWASVVREAKAKFIEL
jgi:hypothetical protein